MGKTALIVVDVQNCFVCEADQGLPRRIAERIAEAGYDEVVFTRFVNNEKSNFHAHGYSKCMEGEEKEIHADLAEEAGRRKVFDKCAFSAFKANGLEEHLRAKEIDELHICGTDTDACVTASAYDAFDLGFRVKIIGELCGSCNGREFHEMGLRLLERNLGFRKAD